MDRGLTSRRVSKHLRAGGRTERAGKRKASGSFHFSFGLCVAIILTVRSNDQADQLAAGRLNLRPNLMSEILGTGP